MIRQCGARDGFVDVIGLLAGQENGPNSPTLKPLLQVCMVRGAEIGSCQHFEEMSKGFFATGIRPVLESKRFRLEEVKDAHNHVWSRKHFGMVVITIGGKSWVAFSSTRRSDCEAPSILT